MHVPACSRLCLSVIVLTTCTDARADQGNVLRIGSRLELFVDDYLIESMGGVTLKLHRPVPREIAIHFDEPWVSQRTSASPQNKFGGFVTVFQDGDRFRMYYSTDGGTPEVACYAESKDGILWTKPSLGLAEFKGSGENNIVFLGPGATVFAPFVDANPAARGDQRYKAFIGRQSKLFGLASPDGIHWRQIREEAVVTQGPFDTLNLAFWDATQEQYVCYLRELVGGFRHIRRGTSQDFLNWTAARSIDLGDAPREHLYTNATTAYFRAPHIYLAFPMRFVPSRNAVQYNFGTSGVSDGVFMTSRDGVRWDRRFMEAFIRPGLDRDNWTHRNLITAWGILPTGKDELSLYYTEHYRHATARLRRASLRLDGFVSAGAPYRGGELVTKPLAFEGKELVLNYSTSAAGSIRVEILDAGGKPISGHALADCPEIYGDQIERVVSWKQGTDVSQLAGRPIRLRFAMADADLYSLRFRP